MPATAPSGHEIPETSEGFNPALPESTKAFQAYAAVRKFEQLTPELANNPYYTSLVDTAYSRFLMNFEAAL